MKELMYKMLTVACAYLIITIPVASATNIKMYMPGGSSREFEVDLKSKIITNFEVATDYYGYTKDPKLKIEILGTDPAYLVTGIYLFRCFADTPDECAGSSAPIVASSYIGGESNTLTWRGDVAEGTTANFMTLVQIDYEGKKFWTGSWDVVERESAEDFVHTSYEIDNLEVELAEGIEFSWMENFIKTYFMLPFQWIEDVRVYMNGGEISSTFRVSGNLEEIATGTIEGESGSGSYESDSNLTFVFGSGTVTEPFTIFHAPPTICKDKKCESAIGENADTCCRDCECDGEDEECTWDDSHPNGLCHVCGDGTPDPVETSENCCADAGCPDGESCDTTVDEPYGSCILPTCNGGRCDTPVESVSNCCTDCGGTDSCKSAYGSNFYCWSDTRKCTLPECGNTRCEPGEEKDGALECCIDCLDVCDEGLYCNKTISEMGKCIGLNCGKGGCEPTENYENCCIDCPCPLDSHGNQLVCEEGSCHFCGNFKDEGSAETEQNCCSDVGCSVEGEYCSTDNSCRDEDDMALLLMIEDPDIDCDQTEEDYEPLSLSLSIENPSQRFVFSSAKYRFKGYEAGISCHGESQFTCDVPLRNELSQNIFSGCFDEGEIDVTFIADIIYYKDLEAGSGDGIFKTLSADTTLNVVNPKPYSCNKNHIPESWNGEDMNTCCTDVGCPKDSVCGANSCVLPGVIGIAVDEDSFADASDLDCNFGVGNDYLEFDAFIENIPHWKDDFFGINNISMVYEGDEKFTKELDLYCEPTEWDGLAPTGKINCKMPMIYFPACPDDSPATITLKMNVSGGGTGPNGVLISDAFQVNYVKGLPYCTPGSKCQKEFYETPERCCINCPCPEDQYCSVKGCVDKDSLTLEITAMPTELDCSDVSTKTLRLQASVTPEPLFPYQIADNNGYYGVAHFDEKLIFMEKEIIGFSETNSWKSELPFDGLDICWYEGKHEVPFETVVMGYNIDDEVEELKQIDQTVSLEVIDERDRECGGTVFRCDDITLGEMVNQCCRDCGCTGGDVCTVDKTCVDPETIELVLSDSDFLEGDDTINFDCLSDPLINLDFEIINEPSRYIHSYFDSNFDPKIEWNMEYTDTLGNSDKELLTSCKNTADSKFTCLINTQLFGPCFDEHDEDMKVTADIKYYDGVLKDADIVHLEKDVKIRPANWGSSCVPDMDDLLHYACEKNQGETEETCCLNCGCKSYDTETDSFICAIESNGGINCVNDKDVKISFVNPQLEMECTMIVSDYSTDWEKRKDIGINSYQCYFKPFSFDIRFENVPVNVDQYSAIAVFYIGDEKIEDVKVEPSNSPVWTVHVKRQNVEMNAIELPSDDVKIVLSAGNYFGVVDNLTATGTIKYKIDMTHDAFVNVKNKIEEFKKTAKWLKAVLYAVIALTGFCAGCSPTDTAEKVNTARNLLTVVGGLAGAGVVGLAIESVLPNSLIGGLLTSLAVGLAAGIALKSFPTTTIVCTAAKPLCLVISLASGSIGIIVGQLSEVMTDVNEDIINEISGAKVEFAEEMTEYWLEMGLP